MPGCGDTPCCVRWQAIEAAYADGRKLEAVQEASRTLGPLAFHSDVNCDLAINSISCRIGRRIVERMVQEGWLS